MKRQLLAPAALMIAVGLAVGIPAGVAYAEPTNSPSATTTTSPKATNLVVKMKAPTHARDTLVFTITGLKKGDWVNIGGKPVGWTQEAPYYKEVQLQGNGPLTVTLEAPVAGWPVDTQYDFYIELADGTTVEKSFTVTKAKATKTKAPTRTPKKKAGGMARTGI